MDLKVFDRAVQLQKEIRDIKHEIANVSRSIGNIANEKADSTCLYGELKLDKAMKIKELELKLLQGILTDLENRFATL